MIVILYTGTVAWGSSRSNFETIIYLDAYGWRNQHWLNVIYHEDLPEDWQLSYYSNVFNTVLEIMAY